MITINCYRLDAEIAPFAPGLVGGTTELAVEMVRATRGKTADGTIPPSPLTMASKLAERPWLDVARAFSYFSMEGAGWICCAGVLDGGMRGVVGT